MCSNCQKMMRGVLGLFAALDANEIVAGVYGEEMAEPAGSYVF